MSIKNNQLSTSFYDAALPQNSDKAFLHLLDVFITEDINVEPTVYHYVDNYVPVEYNDGVESIIYQPASFKISLVGDSAENTPQVSLSFDSGDRGTIRRLRRSEGNPFIQLSVVVAPQSNFPVVTYREWGPVELQLKDFEFKSTALQAKLTVEPFLTEPAPSTSMTPKLAPALWSNKTVSA